MNENDVQVKDETDINSIMRDMMSMILEGALDEQLNEELDYSKYYNRYQLFSRKLIVFPLSIDYRLFVGSFSATEAKLK